MCQLFNMGLEYDFFTEKKTNTVRNLGQLTSRPYWAAARLGSNTKLIAFVFEVRMFEIHDASASADMIIVVEDSDGSKTSWVRFVTISIQWRRPTCAISIRGIHYSEGLKVNWRRDFYGLLFCKEQIRWERNRMGTRSVVQIGLSLPLLLDVFNKLCQKLLVLLKVFMLRELVNTSFCCDSISIIEVMMHRMIGKNGK